MIQEIVQFQEVDTLHIDPLLLDQLDFHVIDVKSLVLDIDTVTRKSMLIELHHDLFTLSFITYEQTP